MVLQNWFYEKDGEKNGPHSEDEIVKMLSSSVLFAHSLVWREGMQSWLQINEIANFQSHIGPPPLPTSYLPQIYMLLVSTSPLWLTMIQLTISITFSKGDDALFWKYYDSKLWLVMYPFLCGFFSKIDSNKLKKSGFKIPPFWGWLFPPVYVYLRGAEFLKINKDGFFKNQIFLFLMLVCLILDYLYDLYLRS